MKKVIVSLIVMATAASASARSIIEQECSLGNIRAKILNIHSSLDSSTEVKVEIQLGKQKREVVVDSIETIENSMTVATKTSGSLKVSFTDGDFCSIERLK